MKVPVPPIINIPLKMRRIFTEIQVPDSYSQYNLILFIPSSMFFFLQKGGHGELKGLCEAFDLSLSGFTAGSGVQNFLDPVSGKMCEKQALRINNCPLFCLFPKLDFSVTSAILKINSEPIHSSFPLNPAFLLLSAALRPFAPDTESCATSFICILSACYCMTCDPWLCCDVFLCFASTLLLEEKFAFAELL